MSADKEPQVVTAADVGTLDAAAVVVTFKPKVDGTGSFFPPGAEAPAQAGGRPDKAARDSLLMEHKVLGAQIARAKARRAEIEDRLAKLDAKLSLAMKLAALTPAERELLEDTLSASAQRRIDAAKADATEPPAPAGA